MQDGDDEYDNVDNTGLSFARVDLPGLAQAITSLQGSGGTGSGGGGSGNGQTQVLAGGGPPDGSAFARGHFVQPTVLAKITPDMRIAQEEVFGPVVGLLEAGDLEEALAIANNTSYGLSAGIVTTDLRRAIRFAERAEAGMVKVNQGTVGASIQAPFGGFKNSGSGMFREMGKGAVEFFTKVKTVYIDGQ